MNKLQKRTGTKFVCELDCNCKDVQLKKYGDNRILVCCGCKPPRILNTITNKYENISIDTSNN